MQDLKVKAFPISAGKLVAVLNEIDAKELGVMAGDRLELTNKKNSKYCVAVVDTTTTSVKEDELGLFEDVMEELSVKNGGVINVRATEPLKSLEYIKKKMMGEKLSSEEILRIIKDISSQRLSDVEASAFVSAVYMKGLDIEETISMAKEL